MGIAGDSLEIKNGIVFINGKELIMPERARPQYSYKASYDQKTPIDFEFLLKDLDVTDGAGFMSDKRDTLFIAAMTFDCAERLKNAPGITSVTRIIHKGSEDGIFPDFMDGKPSVTHTWNNDNFGPIYIPKAGTTVKIDRMTLPFYRKIIGIWQIFIVVHL